MSRRNPTGREWLRELPKLARQLKHTDPDGHEALLWLRDLVLDAAAAGTIDLAQPITVRHYEDTGHVEIANRLAVTR